MSNVSKQVKEILAKKGEASVDEIMEVMGVDNTYRRRVAQSLGQSPWAERVARGRYVYQNGSRPVERTTSAELQPLIDTLSDEEFDQVGLTYVARTQDGGFICTDRNGAAWLVEVIASARLI